MKHFLFLFTLTTLIFISACSETITKKSKQTKSHDQISWKVTVDQSNTDTTTLVIKAQLKDKWILYTNENAGKKGPVSALFYYSPKVLLLGETEAIGSLQKFDTLFEVPVNYFQDSATFVQKIAPETKDQIEIRMKYQVEHTGNGECPVYIDTFLD